MGKLDHRAREPSEARHSRSAKLTHRQTMWQVWARLQGVGRNAATKGVTDAQIPTEQGGYIKLWDVLSVGAGSGTTVAHTLSVTQD